MINLYFFIDKYFLYIDKYIGDIFYFNRASRKKEPKKMLTPATDQNGSQVNFYYGAPTPYAESIAPSHHSTYAHYYDDEEDGWEMPNFYNETYMKGEHLC